ncbi:MAG: DUF2065 domain-containing protein [Hyphomicrobiaceae bacterium]|nr:DUF2065 domain-containing protein [Hyphomicrobiaceae bacterium]
MSTELLSALGLVFVIEGLIWALFPRFFVKMALQMQEVSDGQIRSSGAVAIAFGVFVVWLVRG